MLLTGSYILLDMIRLLLVYKDDKLLDEAIIRYILKIYKYKYFILKFHKLLQIF